MRLFKRKKKQTIDVDEIFLDSSNLPAFNTGRLEGRLEVPVGSYRIIAVGVFFSLIACVFLGQLFYLQIVRGEEYASRSNNNHIDKSLLFAERGIILDRNGERLAWNAEGTDKKDFAERAYTNRAGLGQLLGHVNYPKKDTSGFYFRTEYAGRGGVEESYNTRLAGENGERLLEVDVHGAIISEHVVHMPKSGQSVYLTIDARVSEALYMHIATSSAKAGFRSGAGAIMDVETGEIIALASYPSYDPMVMVRGDAETIDQYTKDERLPFLNKIVAGVYTPGSIVKPFMALAALTENTISPEKEIISTGSLVIPNPYTPSQPSVFTDWKAHGAVAMRQALAVSSNVYFYVVGGGYKDQKGLGITKIHEYMELFGFTKKTGIRLPGEGAGVVPNPAWKKEKFNDEWRLGDTYNTSIGQFGFQVTPIEMLRAYTAIANKGTLLTPLVVQGELQTSTQLPISEESFQIIHEGMKLSAEEGTARALNQSTMKFGGKTGTAELGSRKEFVNSWVIGFYPYEKPKYAFVLLMERGPRANLFGASPIMSQFFIWMRDNAPEYFEDTISY